MVHLWSSFLLFHIGIEGKGQRVYYPRRLQNYWGHIDIQGKCRWIIGGGGGG